MKRAVLNRPVLVAVALAVCVVASAMLVSADPERAVVFMLVEGEPAELAPRIAELPVRVRLVDLDRVLLEVDADDVARVANGLPAVVALTEPLRGVELYDMHTHSGMRVMDRGPDVATLIEDDRVWIVAAPSMEQVPGAHPLPLVYDLQALVPHTADELAHPLRQSRLDDPAARARAAALMAQVSEANIEAIVRMLSEISPGVPSSRYVRRSHLNGEIADSLLARMRTIFSAPGDTVFAHTFKIEGEPDSIEVHNLIGRRPGRVPGSARYVLGAHYDAIGSNTPDWDPATDPAPGADDNASGTASMLEASRVLMSAEFDFGVELALFTAEEIGLVGSRRLIADYGYDADSVIAAVVADMVGFNPRGVDSLSVVTNGRSEWLADRFEEANDILPPADGLEYADKDLFPTFGRSDHGAFWAAGMDALLLIETPFVEVHNPYYHQIADTADNLAAAGGFDMIRRVTELVVGTLGQYSNPTGDVELTSDELTFFDENGHFLAFARAGEPVRVHMRFLNEGAGIASAQVVAYPRVSSVMSATGAIGPSSTSLAPPATIDTVFTGWGTGTWREVVYQWIPSEEQGGRQEVRVEAHLDGNDGREWMFEADARVTVLGSSLQLLDAHVRPNPVRGSLNQGSISFQLNERGDINVMIFDALGREVANTAVGFFDAGRHEIRLDQVIHDDQPSGVYLARILVDGGRFDTGATETQVTFAYAR